MNKKILFCIMAILAIIQLASASSPKKADVIEKENSSFIPAFISSFAMILVSEIGDKTFFIAAIMAMKHSRALIFSSATAALVVMTVLSVLLGMTLPMLVSKEVTHIASCLLFIVFGANLLLAAYRDEQGSIVDEMTEVEEELKISDIDKEGDEVDLESQSLIEKETKKTSFLNYIFSPVFVQCFTLTFLAEWGDRSQISTIALASAKNIYGVCIGGIIGHMLCTSFAVFSGKLIAYKISERMINIIGGILFLLFAITGFYFGPDQ